MFYYMNILQETGRQKTSLTPTGVKNTFKRRKNMASITIHYHSYEINSLADLAMVRAQLEELYKMKKVTDLEYKTKSKQLDQFPRNHHLSK